MIIETNKNELYLFDVSDPLFPKYLMTLPVPERLSPHTKGGNYFYNCIEDRILILPFSEISEFPSANVTMHLLVYDLLKPIHTILLYKYTIPFKIKIFKSFIHSRFADTDYLYLFADSTILVVKAFTGFVISFPDKDVEYLKQVQHVNLKLTVVEKDANVTQPVSLHSIQTGIVLKSGSNHIKIHVPKDISKYYLNLDEYFKGYRG